ncbi:MAG: hypothetical protein JSS61_07155, partial [Verrucomicrobia bacterium]|nr:hypothetical protein [Verrucomicrobiota bacterium]
MSFEMRDVGGSSPLPNPFSDRGVFVDENGYLVNYQIQKISENGNQAFYVDARNKPMMESSVMTILDVFEKKINKDLGTSKTNSSCYLRA